MYDLNTPTPIAAPPPPPRRDLSTFIGHNPVVLLAIIGIILLCVISQVMLKQIHQRQEKLVQNHLESTLNSLSKLLATWQDQHAAAIQVITDTRRGRDAILGVLRDRGQNPVTNGVLKEVVLPVMEPLGYEGYSVFTADRFLIAATSAGYVGRYVNVPQTAEVMDRALAGQTAISRPIAADKTISGPRGDRPPGSLFQMMCITVRGDTRELLGYFCFRFDPHTAFFPIFASAMSGESGELYAINRDGKLVTPSRFTTGSPPLSLAAVVPGTDGQFSLAARKLLKGEPLHPGTAYPDYRGVPVVGATRWLDAMNIGLISEQDYAEAFGPYRAARDVIVALSLSGIALLVLLCITSVLNRKALAQRESRFRSLLENLPTPVYMKSLAGNITVVNSFFCQLTENSRADLLRAGDPAGLIPRWLAPIFADDTQVTPGYSAHTKTLELTDPHGEQCFYRLVRFPVVSRRADRPEAIATVIINDTERVLAARQLHDVNLRLERQVEERTRELRLAKETAVTASKTKAEFLANMSHEIRTPLNAVLGLAHLSLAEPLPAKVRTYLEKIQASGRHLLQVINDILDFSRIEAGKMTLDARAFAMPQLLESVVTLVWDRADQKGVKLHIDIDPDLPEIWVGDPLRLGQILINFTANAVKFTEHGGVTLRVARDPHATAPPSSIALIFAVEDTGIGIDPEQLASLFQPFHQVDASSRRRFQGSGLGLAICKNLAQLMNATIEVDSTPSQGSCFRLHVTLPLGGILPQRAHQAGANSVLPQTHCRVLLVEDDALNREIAESLLLACGASVSSAEDGPEALAKLEQETFDLVLMDMQMPGMDGLETTNHMRARSQAANLPIIALTANTLPGDRERYLAGGMDDYLAKPIDPRELHLTLLRWQGPTQPPVASNPTVVSEEFDSLQDAGVNTVKALDHLLGDSALYQRMLERFVNERSDLPEQLNQALRQGRLESLRELIHSLRSVAATLGLDTLASLAGQQETALNQGQSPPAIDELSIQFRRDLTLLRAWLDQTGPDRPVQSNP